jgi:hypothetical protein
MLIVLFLLQMRAIFLFLSSRLSLFYYTPSIQNARWMARNQGYEIFSFPFFFVLARRLLLNWAKQQHVFPASLRLLLRHGVLIHLFAVLPPYCLGPRVRGIWLGRAEPTTYFVFVFVLYTTFNVASSLPLSLPIPIFPPFSCCKSHYCIVPSLELVCFESYRFTLQKWKAHTDCSRSRNPFLPSTSIMFCTEFYRYVPLFTIDPRDLFDSYQLPDFRYPPAKSGPAALEKYLEAYKKRRCEFWMAETRKRRSSDEHFDWDNVRNDSFSNWLCFVTSFLQDDMKRFQGKLLRKSSFAPTDASLSDIIAYLEARIHEMHKIDASRCYRIKYRIFMALQFVLLPVSPCICCLGDILVDNERKMAWVPSSDEIIPGKEFEEQNPLPPLYQKKRKARRARHRRHQ